MLSELSDLPHGALDGTPVPAFQDWTRDLASRRDTLLEEGLTWATTSPALRSDLSGALLARGLCAPAAPHLVVLEVLEPERLEDPTSRSPWPQAILSWSPRSAWVRSPGAPTWSWTWRPSCSKLSSLSA
jgi:hypothetical protein